MAVKFTRKYDKNECRPGWGSTTCILKGNGIFIGHVDAVFQYGHMEQRSVLHICFHGDAAFGGQFETRAHAVGSGGHDENVFICYL